MEYPIRINKYMADMGMSTRRGADALIAKGSVLVNGKKAVIGQSISEGDEVTLRGATASSYVYYAYNKPRGVITHSPAEGEVDILSAVKRDHNLTGVFPIGRLDKDSEGLILLTNDGRITKRILNKEHEHEKEYEVRLDKPISNHFLKHITQGVVIEGEMTLPADVRQLTENSCRITITEGKKHQLRRMCAALGYQVKSLKRVRVGTIRLGTLAPGKIFAIVGKHRDGFLASLGL
jgi:23S rRNA pseudouridine2604 synthase